MSTPSNSFRFFHVGIEGLNLVTRGLAYEYSGVTMSGFTTVYVTGVGLVTQGLVFGLGDFWQYADDPQDAGWTLVN